MLPSFGQIRFFGVMVAVSALFLGVAPAQTTFVNITNIGSLSGSIGAASIVDNYAYLAGCGLQVYEISNPIEPVLEYSDSGPASALDVCTDGNRAYVAYTGGPVVIFDISNRANPVPIGHIDGYWSTVATSGGLVLLGPEVGPTFQIAVYDVSDPTNPLRLNTQLQYRPTRIAARGNHAYIIDGRLNIIDLSDPSNLHQVGSTPYFEAVDVAISGAYAYVACWTNGFSIYNVSNATNPLPVYNSIGNTYGAVALSGNYAYLIGDKLVVYDVSNPASASLVAEIPLPQSFVCCNQHGLAVTKGYAYAYYPCGISVYSLGQSSPNLSLTCGDNVFCSWSTPASAFAVQQNADLNPAHWTQLTNVPAVVGSRNQVAIRRQAGTMFYRLVSQ